MAKIAYPRTVAGSRVISINYRTSCTIKFFSGSVLRLIKQKINDQMKNSVETQKEIPEKSKVVKIRIGSFQYLKVSGENAMKIDESKRSKWYQEV